MIKSLIAANLPMTVCVTVMWLSLLSCCAMLGIVVYKHMAQVSLGPAVLDCEVNPGARPLRAQVADCASAPCALPQRQYTVVDVTFRAPRNTSNMTTVASAYISLGFEMAVPYDLGEATAACSYLTDSSCPLQEGQLVNLKLRIYVPSTIVTSPTVEFSVVDDQAKPMMCIRVPILIISGAERRAHLARAMDTKYNEVNQTDLTDTRTK